ncbi:MAG: hypothetical protein DI551_07045 [Micavibrio aeruginosavorus]|uniref:NfeD-like C-terminal domain-containing protein n=1 Tax=Micavibrio aeruginosavorus TaxID=349221 RepID=A0A2W5Q2K4_9BACT|nr:MAG: hypothetical protein DI551_07045 [Micavibrio aeruginosavorus]
MGFIETLEYWHWLILGLILLGLEILVFGAVFLWFGIAALFVGALAFFVPALMWQPQIVIWAVLAVVGAFGWQLYRRKNPAPVAEATMNKRGAQYVGRHYTLMKDIVNGTGELHVDDTRWKVTCHHDLPAGTKVKVLAVEGTSLRVEEYIS